MNNEISKINLIQLSTYLRINYKHNSVIRKQIRYSVLHTTTKQPIVYADFNLLETHIQMRLSI